MSLRRIPWALLLLYVAQSFEQPCHALLSPAGKKDGGVATSQQPKRILQQQAGSNLVAFGDTTYGATNLPTLLTDSVVDVAAGRFHALALLTNGTVVSWGSDYHGQVSSQPAETRINGNVVAIAAGDDFSLAVLKTGRIVSWGDDASLQSSLPLAANATAIACGATSCIVLSNGNVSAFGDTSVPDGYPSQPTFNTTVTKIGARAGVFTALTVDGQVYVWGISHSGSSDPSTAGLNWDLVWPANAADDAGKFPNPSPAKDLSCADTRCLSVYNNGTVLTWGLNSTDNSDSPWAVAPQYLSGKIVTSVSAGIEHSVAQLSDGSIYAWGSNEYGQLNVPESLAQANNFTTKKIVTGYFTTYVLASGLPMQAPQTPPKTGPPVIQPVPLPTGPGLYAYAWNDATNVTDSIPAATYENVADICNGVFYVLQLSADGTATLSLNTASGTLEPQPPISNITQISCSSSAAVLLQSNGKVLVWDASSEDVMATPPNEYFQQGNVVGIAVGDSHVISLLNDGSVTGWGDNSQGQLNIPGIAKTGVKAVAAGGGFSVALLTNGTVVGWGKVAVPSTVSSANVTQVSCGSNHCLALSSTGQVYTWGSSDTDPGDPAIIVPAGLTTAKTIAIKAGTFAQSGFSMALLSNNTVVTWGSLQTASFAMSDVNGIAAGSNGTAYVFKSTAYIPPSPAVTMNPPTAQPPPPPPPAESDIQDPNDNGDNGNPVDNNSSGHGTMDNEQSDSHGKSGGASSGTIAGAVIGSLLGVAVIAGVTVYFLRHRRNAGFVEFNGPAPV